MAITAKAKHTAKALQRALPLFPGKKQVSYNVRITCSSSLIWRKGSLPVARLVQKTFDSTSTFKSAWTDASSLLVDADALYDPSPLDFGWAYAHARLFVKKGYTNKIALPRLACKPQIVQNIQYWVLQHRMNLHCHCFKVILSAERELLICLHSSSSFCSDNTTGCRSRTKMQDTDKVHASSNVPSNAGTNPLSVERCLWLYRLNKLRRKLFQNGFLCFLFRLIGIQSS